jgi:tetratricopeptide (TPR) repeat protein
MGAGGLRRRMARDIHRRFIIDLVVFLLVIMLCPAICLGNGDLIYKQNNAAVVVILALDGNGQPVGLGSGFIVREDGAVVTSYHVVSMAADIKVKVGDKTVAVEGLLHADPENDLAVLKLEGKGYPKVKLGDADKLRVGETIYVMGSPRGLENTLSSGIVSALRRIDKGRLLLQITAAISPGSSGGPVFDARGEVVGVATFIMVEAQSLNFAMPINLVKPGLANRRPVSPENSCSLDFTKTVDCWLFQGMAYSASGDHERAGNAFRRALTIDPKRADAYLNLGGSLLALGRYGEAAQALEQGIKLDPGRSEGLISLAVVYSQMGRDEEALADLNKSLALQPDNPAAYLGLTLVYGKAGRHREALEAALQAVRLDPLSADAQQLAGVAYAKQQRYPEAATAFKAAIRLNPEDPRTHLSLGKVYVEMNEKAAAMEEYKILRNLSPDAAKTLLDVIYR